MTSRLRIFASVFTLLVAASSLAGCSFEPGERTQLVGQECYNDDQCVSGAVCVQRRCQYEAQAQTGDAGGQDVGGQDAEAQDADPDPADGSPMMDVPATETGGEEEEEICRPGARRCISDTELEFCRDDGTVFERRTCVRGRTCEDGECVAIDPSVCRAQSQRCDEEGENNGYYCGDIFRLGELRCIGLCDTTVDDRDATCPDANTECIPIEDEESIGFCLTKCNTEDGCDTPGLECDAGFNSQGDGICLPPDP